MVDSTLDLSSSERRRVKELVDALRTPLQSDIANDTQLTSRAFVDEFESRLLAHHVFLGNPLFQESFDTAFLAACRVAGFESEDAAIGQRFWDIQVNGKKISLKSTRAKGLRKETLHISKLTEAAWIQDCRTAKQRHKKTLELFDEYCGEVDEIIQLRYFATDRRYELVGVSTTVIGQVLQLPVSAFNADGPTINIPIGKNPADFTLKLDRSDAKITLANIQKSECVVYGTWRVKTATG